MKQSDNGEDYLRFDVSSDFFRRRTSIVNSVLHRFPVVGATGSYLEAHLVARLGLSGAVPNLVGCGISSLEVHELCARSENVLLFLTESIAKDLGHDLVLSLKERHNESIRIVYILQDRSLARQIQNFNVDAFVLATSFGSGAIARALLSISCGKFYLDPDMLRAIQEADAPYVTKRERQVLHLLEQGMSNKEIAIDLLISPVTVRDYVQSLMRKFGANNRMLVVTNARVKGLL